MTTQPDILTQCLLATGATPDQALKATAAVYEPDAVGLLLQHQVAALVRLGRPVDEAKREAADIVATMLSDLCRMFDQDVHLGVALRQGLVYRFRCQQGMAYACICERLGISRKTADMDYRTELLRRRAG